jgi:Arc/MetJ-type ribon-helix-helix transcriptional regulator
MNKRGADMVTLKIPRPLYQRLKQLIEDTGFRSVTEFAIYVLRDLAAQPAPPAAAEGTEAAHGMTDAELAEARKRLQDLGYL